MIIISGDYKSIDTSSCHFTPQICHYLCCVDTVRWIRLQFITLSSIFCQLVRTSIGIAHHNVNGCCAAQPTIIAIKVLGWITYIITYTCICWILILDITVSSGSDIYWSVVCQIGHVNNIPTMQFFSGISRNTQSKTYMLRLTECVWEFRKMHCGILINIPYWKN